MERRLKRILIRGMFFEESWKQPAIHSAMQQIGHVKGICWALASAGRASRRGEVRIVLSSVRFRVLGPGVLNQSLFEV